MSEHLQFPREGQKFVPGAGAVTDSPDVERQNEKLNMLGYLRSRFLVSPVQYSEGEPLMDSSGHGVLHAI
jgi:hypothetical protein